MGGELEGKVAIVTGGGWNIGRAVALRFARAGARVVVSARRPGPLEETVAAVESEGGEALAHPADVRAPEAMEELAARTLERFGTVDVLAALAGGGATDEAVDEIDPRWWNEVVHTNVGGTFHAVRAVLPTMRERGAGSILTCGGGGAWAPMEGVRLTAYAAAKAAIGRLTDQLALELLDTGIRVNCIVPGLTLSPDALRALEAEERESGGPHPQRAVARPPEESAELALWLASDASAPLTGRSIAPAERWWRDRATVERVCTDVHAFCLRRHVPGWA